MGGTPMYAGPRTYEEDQKDLFSVGRMASEMFMDPEGIGRCITVWAMLNVRFSTNQ